MATIGFIQRKNTEARSQLMIKERNMRRLFDLINTYGEISRASLASKAKLSPTTVSTLIDELISGGVVVTSGVENSNKIGRKGILIRINPDRLQIPTIAWERGGFRYILYDLACNEVESFFIPFINHVDYVKELHDIVINKSQMLDRDKLGALCISAPAIIDPQSHKLVSTVLDVEGQEDFLIQIRQHFLSRPVMVGNESAFYAYAEKEFALKRKTENVVYINVNIGVGAGIIYQGKIYRGTYGMAGEFGHTSVDMNGPICSCGNRGCIERFVSTPRIIERVVEAVRKNKSSQLYDEVSRDPSSVTQQMIAQAYLDKDQVVTKAMNEIAKILSFGINNIIRVFDPETVVIGGGIEIFGPDFLNAIKSSLDMYGPNILKSGVSLTYTQLSPSCKNKGAAKYFIDNIMKFTEQTSEDVMIC